MKNDKFFCVKAARIIAAGLLLAACTAESVPPPGGEKPGENPFIAEYDQEHNITADLERIAEIERAGAFFPGLALAESGIRERAGDFNGAAVAAYKELAWAYGCGTAVRSQVEQGLRNALILMGEAQEEEKTSFPAAALRGCMAFAREEWSQAEELLSLILKNDEEPDSFLRWMLLVCGMEGKADNPDESKSIRTAYSAIRARYALFPEYWYRGARAFADRDRSIAAAYAEQCINTSPQGPFSGDCRKILSEHLGLVSLDMHPNDIRTKAEIENTIRASVSMNNPAILQELFPLINLPENPYTVYAMSAMKTLSSVPEFRSFFYAEALNSQGRLGERLNYISRG